jgi:ribokinase
MPKCNETLHSESFQTGFGGKGANQAIAACRLGCKTAMIAKLGADPYGIMYKEHFHKEEVNSEFVELIPSIHSGIALIVVDTTNGNNQIVINANANQHLSKDDCSKAKELLENSKVNTAALCCIFFFTLPYYFHFSHRCSFANLKLHLMRPLKH